MPRRRRHDRPGAEFHVMNRGIARRTVFDERSDYRFFLAGLARAVRRREIVVLAYALMRTHFHLLVRSLGGLSTAMQRVQLRHVRRFNRRHRRDGPLLRNRFVAKEVVDFAHARNVVHYTHENPVLARLCDRPAAYPWSSAGLCASGRIPRWFSMEALERCGLRRGLGRPAPSRAVMTARADLVEARLRSRRAEEDEALDLSTPQGVLEWMVRKAQLADGDVSGLPQVGPRTLLAAMAIPAGSGTTPVPGAGRYPTRDLLAAGMLRDVSCCAWAQIAEVMDQPTSRVRRLAGMHRRCLRRIPEYRRLASDIVSSCLRMLED